MLVHIYSLYEPLDPDARRRLALAKSTWSSQPWTEIPVSDGQLSRLFNEGAKRLPFIADLINVGTKDCDLHDIAVFTNIDTCVASNASVRIALALQTRDVCYAFRRDFGRLDLPVPDNQISTGADYPGTDLFAFRVGWWKDWWTAYPNLILGRESWDACMRVLMESTEPNKPLALPDLIFHEKHENSWENLAIRYTLPGQRHNLALAKVFLASRGLNPASFAVR